MDGFRVQPISNDFGQTLIMTYAFVRYKAAPLIFINSSADRSCIQCI